MRRRFAPGLLAIAVALAGCASIPSESGVEEVENPAGEVPDLVVGVYANEPQPGASPEQIVRGFLEASGAVNFPVAELYLTDEARTEWNPDRPVIVYDSLDVAELSSSESDSEVRFTAQKTAEVNERRVYTPTISAGELDETFSLANTGSVDGEPVWRIAEPPDALYVSETDFDLQYDSYDLFYLDPGRQVLVPDPIILRTQAGGVANRLIDDLLRGPTAWLQPGVTTAVPSGAARNGDVRIEGGVATVVIAADANAARPQLDDLLAQVVLTLDQLDEVEEVSIRLNDEQPTDPVAADSYPTMRPAGPSGPPAVRLAYVRSDDGRLLAQPVGEGRATPTPIEGPFGSADGRRLRSFAVKPPLTGPSTDTIAGVSDEGTEVYLAEGAVYLENDRAVVTGTNLSSPSWDRFGRLWLLDRTDSGTEVVMRADGQVYTVPVTGLTGAIEEIAVSDDGSRVALVVSGTGGARRAEIRVVEPTEQGFALVNPRPLAPTLAQVTEVAWRDAYSLAVLGRAPDDIVVQPIAVQPYLVPVDSLSVEPQAPLPAEPVAVAAAPGLGLPILVGTSDGRVWEGNDGPWTLISEGFVDPRYAG